MPRKPTGRPPGRPRGSGDLGIGEQGPRVTLRLPQALYARLAAFAEGAHFHRGDPQVSGCIRDAIVYYLDAMARPGPDPGDNSRQTATLHSETPGEYIRQTGTQPAEGQREGIRQTGTRAERSIKDSRQRITRSQQRITDYRQAASRPQETEGKDRRQTGTSTLEGNGSGYNGIRQTETVPREAMRKIGGRQEPAPQDAQEHTGDGRRQTGTVLPLGKGKNGGRQEPSPDGVTYYLGRLCPAGDDYQGTGKSLIRRANQRCWECDKRQKREARARKKAAAQAQEG